MVSCGQSSSCQTNVGTPSNGNNATFVASPGAPGLLIASVNANNGTQLVCAGYTSADTNTYESFLTSDRSKVITTTIKTPAIPLTGTPATTSSGGRDCGGSAIQARRVGVGKPSDDRVHLGSQRLRLGPRRTPGWPRRSTRARRCEGRSGGPGSARARGRGRGAPAMRAPDRARRRRAGGRPRGGRGGRARVGRGRTRNASASRTLADGLMSRPCSSHVYQDSPTPASWQDECSSCRVRDGSAHC